MLLRKKRKILMRVYHLHRHDFLTIFGCGVLYHRVLLLLFWSFRIIQTLKIIKLGAGKVTNTKNKWDNFCTDI